MRETTPKQPAIAWDHDCIGQARWQSRLPCEDRRQLWAGKSLMERWQPGLIPYRLLNSRKNELIAEIYRKAGEKEPNIVFDGRLGDLQVPGHVRYHRNGSLLGE